MLASPSAIYSYGYTTTYSTCKEGLLGLLLTQIKSAPCPEGAPVRYSNARGFDWGVYGVAAVGM